MKGEETKQKILFAAIDLISDSGFEQMSMRALAKKVNMRPSNTYHYFDGKEDILNSIIDHISDYYHLLQVSSSEIKKLLQTKTPEQVLRWFILANEPSDVFQHLRLSRLLYMETYRENSNLRTFTHRHFFQEPTLSFCNFLEILVRLKAIPETDTIALGNAWQRTSMFYSFEATHFFMDSLNEQACNYKKAMHFFTTCALRGVTPLQGDFGPFTRPLWENPFSNSANRRVHTADRIILAAFNLIDKNGGDSVSVRDLCEEVGIQPGSFYNHFESKDQVFEILNQQFFTSIEGHAVDKDVIKQFILSRDIPGLISQLALINAPVNDARSLSFNRVLSREQYRNEAMRNFFWNAMRRYINTIAQALRESMEEGAIPLGDPDMIAEAYVYTMGNIHIGATMFEDERQTMEGLRDRIGKWFLGLIFNGFQT